MPFPGFVARRRSENNGKTYHLLNAHCRFAWLAKPGDNGPDEIDVQHYPRVARADSGARVMVFA